MPAICTSLPSFQDGKNGWDLCPGVSLALNPRLQPVIPIGIQRDGFAGQHALLKSNKAAALPRFPKGYYRPFTNENVGQEWTTYH
jgi:hypothetical protein